jgi:Family of unknown function (DUF5681)
MSKMKNLSRPSGRRAKKALAEDHTVGYCKPPRAHQFKPGNNANPKGRPKGTSNGKLLIRKLLLEPISAREGNAVKTMSKLEAIVTQTINDALKGDHKSRLTAIGMARENGLLTPGQAEAVDDEASKDIAARLDAAFARLAEDEAQELAKLQLDGPPSQNARTTPGRDGLAKPFEVARAGNKKRNR